MSGIPQPKSEFPAPWGCRVYLVDSRILSINPDGKTARVVNQYTVRRNWLRRLYDFFFSEAQTQETQAR